MARKIIQIACNDHKVFALYDDGSLYEMPAVHGNSWIAVAGIEQPTTVGSPVPVAEGEPSPAFLKGQRDARAYGVDYRCPYHHTNTYIVEEWWSGFKTVYPNVHCRL